MKKIITLWTIAIFSFLLAVQIANAQDKIEGPWMWMVVNTVKKGGGAAVTNDDWIDDATGGKLTEEVIAKGGITDAVLKVKFADKHEWTEGKIAAVGGDNLNEALVKLKFGVGDINDHCAYAVINAVSKKKEAGVTARVGSDDSIKVWMNGEEVHVNPVDRGAADFLDTFDVDLKNGDNTLMVKVCERGGGWSMFVGIDANLTYDLNFKGLAVEPAAKLATQWGEIKKSF